MRNHKKIWAIALGFCVVALLCGVIYYVANHSSDRHIYETNSVEDYSLPQIDLNIDIDAVDANPANNKQYASYIELSVVDGKLYMWNVYDHVLTCFEDGAFQLVSEINGSWIGSSNGKFYFEAKNQEESYSVFVCDPESGVLSPLATLDNKIDDRGTFFTEDGVYIPMDYSGTSYCMIAGSHIVEGLAQYESYQIGPYTYMLKGEREKADLICYDANGETKSYGEEIPYGLKSMIPCENGLLIHNETNGDFLYFVESETGDVIELFTADCIYASSAVNVWNGDAYLSFVRYQEYGSLGLAGKRDENDALNGTYRISLEDYSIEKISDDIYNGLFIFDDTGIYACNADMEVYKLDFDGNILFQLH